MGPESGASRVEDFCVCGGISGVKGCERQQLSASLICEQIFFFGLHTLLLSACTCKYLATPQRNHPPPLFPPRQTRTQILPRNYLADVKYQGQNC